MFDAETVLDFELTRDAVFSYTQARIRLCFAASNSGKRPNPGRYSRSRSIDPDGKRCHRYWQLACDYSACSGRCATDSGHDNTITQPNGTPTKSSEPAG